MKRNLAILTICALSVAACGRYGSKATQAELPATTGHFDLNGVDYIAGGDNRMAGALKDTPPPAPDTQQKKALAHRIKEFEISRFDKDQSNPAQLGAARATLKVFFEDQAPLEFSAPFQQQNSTLQFTATSGNAKLSGSLTDGQIESKGDFTLQVGVESARILYRAYKAKIDVRSDKEKPIAAGSKLENQIKALKGGAYAWVHNWNVVHGPAVYLVDIVASAEAAQNIPFFAFKGESKRTGDQEHPATPVSGDTSADIKLIGNAEEESRRLFAVEVKEEKNQPASEFLIDVEMENDKPMVDLLPEEQPTETPSHHQFSYLNIHLGQPRMERMNADFEKNRKVTGVKKFIAKFQRNLRGDLENFYRYANPFRSLIESIGQSFDVSPAFAYLTVVESAYFTGGRYRIEKASTSSALGPFQLIDGTARLMGLAVTHNNSDERRFFAPSACGAARYVGDLVNKFSDHDSGDATVAILAYYQGQGGAAAAVHCSMGDVTAREACAKRINSGYKGSDYNRFIKLAKNYSYTYADIDRLAVIPANMRNYVNKKLAVYFISNDMARYGFKVPSNAPRAFPANGTVFPNQRIKNSKCQSVIENFKAGS